MMRVSLFISLLLCFNGLLAQDKIEIVNANDLIFDNSSGISAKRLVGNVLLKHDNTLMYCDSAYMYNENNSFEAFGNVKILEGDSVEMTGKYLKYNGESKLAYFKNDVILKHNDLLLLTPSFTFNRESQYGYYTEGGTIYTNNKKDTLTSKRGYYYSGLSEARFRDSVVVRSSSYKVFSDTLHYNSNNERSLFLGPTKIIDYNQIILCERGWTNSKEEMSEFSKNAVIYSDDTELRGDTIRFNQREDYGEAFGNVLMADTSENYFVRGQYAWHSKKDSLSIVTGKAEYVQVDGKDSLFLHGDSLLASYDTNNLRLIKIFNHVAFFRKDMQGRCDSLVMSDSDSSIHMYNSPIIWSEENQITGEYIRMLRVKGKIDRMFINDRAFICSEVDSVKFNQIKGKRMNAYFVESKLKKVHVFEKPQTLYYIEESDSSFLGMNTAQSENMLGILLDSNQVQQLIFFEQPSGLTLPLEDTNKSNSTLEGFIWKKHIRPMRKEDIFFHSKNAKVELTEP